MEKNKKTPKKNEQEDLYQLTCNKRQLSIISRCLEENSRMMCGQIELTYQSALDDEIWDLYYKKCNTENEEYYKIKNEVDYHLAEIKKIIWGYGRGVSKGIGHKEGSDLRYEMYKEILYLFEQENKERCKKEGKEYNECVHSYEPLKLTKEPKIKVEKIYKSSEKQ
jgi:hypothetical protein